MDAILDPAVRLDPACLEFCDHLINHGGRDMGARFKDYIYSVFVKPEENPSISAILQIVEEATSDIQESSVIATTAERTLANDLVDEVEQITHKTSNTSR